MGLIYLLPNNASRWQVGFNLTLKVLVTSHCINCCSYANFEVFTVYLRFSFIWGMMLRRWISGLRRFRGGTDYLPLQGSRLTESRPDRTCIRKYIHFGDTFYFQDEKLRTFMESSKASNKFNLAISGSTDRTIENGTWRHWMKISWKPMEESRILWWFCGKVTGWRTGDRGSELRMPVGAKIFSCTKCPGPLWGQIHLLDKGHRGNLVVARCASYAE